MKQVEKEEEVSSNSEESSSSLSDADDDEPSRLEDMSRLSKRQRMALMATEESAVEIGKHNRNTVLSHGNGETVFYALQNKKANTKAHHSVEEYESKRPR